MIVKKVNHSRPRFSNLFDELFNGEFPAMVNRDFSKNVPSVNVIENGDSYRIELAAPGFKKDDFNVSVDDNLLTISGEVKSSEENKDEKFTRREFNYSSFKRSFNLPETVNNESIKANYEDGILSISLPKLEEVKAISKTIEIE